MADKEQIKNEQDYIVTMYNVAADRDEDFYHLATVEYNQKYYAVLQPVEALDDVPEDEVLIYEVKEVDADNAELVPIEDESVLQAVFDKFVEEYSLDDIEEGCECNCGCGQSNENACCCGETSEKSSCCDSGAKKNSGCGCKH